MDQTRFDPTNEALRSAQIDHTLKAFSKLLAGLIAVFSFLTVLPSLLRWFVPTYDTAPANLCLVAAGALGAGGLVGFIYGMFGDAESQRFSAFFTLVSGALGSLTIADISKPDSSIQATLQALAQSCGLKDSAGGVIAAVIAAFAPLGFMLFYLYNVLLLNNASAIVFARRKVLESSRLLLHDDRLLPQPDPATGKPVAPPPPDENTRRAAQIVLKRPGAGRLGSAEDLVVDARAYAVAGDQERSVLALRNAAAVNPDDLSIKLTLAKQLLLRENAGTENEAAGLLRQVVSGPNPPLGAWKLFGYALLWSNSEESLRESIAASDRYLTSSPNDPGAMLNKACACAQLYGMKAEQSDKTQCLSILSTLFKVAPTMRARVTELLHSDFASLKDCNEFKNLLVASPSS